MPDWLLWGNVGLRDCSRRHVLRGSPLIGHRSADAPDGVASWLARELVLEMLTRTDVFLWTMYINNQIGVMLKDRTCISDAYMLGLC